MSQLAQRLACGESKAFTELYDLCGNQMHHFLMMKRMSREDAGDLIQEVFLRLVRKREAFRNVENPVAFAFQVARNEAHRWLSRTIRKREQFRMIASDLLVEVTPCQLGATDWSEAVASALAALPDEQSEVIVLKIFSGFTLLEIASITGAPQGTVATRYRRGIEKMKEILGGTAMSEPNEFETPEFLLRVTAPDAPERLRELVIATVEKELGQTERRALWFTPTERRCFQVVGALLVASVAFCFLVELGEQSRIARIDSKKTVQHRDLFPFLACHDAPKLHEWFLNYQRIAMPNRPSIAQIQSAFREIIERDPEFKKHLRRYHELF